jgi:hypothetical protein
MKGIASLNVYKKVAIVRRASDTLSYEDIDGTIKTISDLGEAAATSVRLKSGFYVCKTCRAGTLTRPFFV